MLENRTYISINQQVFLLNACLNLENGLILNGSGKRCEGMSSIYISISISLRLIYPAWLPLTFSLSLIKVMERSYESQGRWSAVSCCHWPRTRRICRDRQYARAGQKLIPWIIKAKEKSTEDVALLRRRRKKYPPHLEAQSSPAYFSGAIGYFIFSFINSDFILLQAKCIEFNRKNNSYNL